MNILTVILVAISGFAMGTMALPHLYQGKKEIKAILDSEELDNYLAPQEIINSIRKVENGYEIETNEHLIFVEVIYEEMKHPGPVPFRLEFFPIDNLQNKN